MKKKKGKEMPLQEEPFENRSKGCVKRKERKKGNNNRENKVCIK